VPNPSFEEYTDCPTWDSQLFLASPWQMPSNIGNATSDYFNACDSMGFVSGVPYNSLGYQNAHIGKGYSGFYTYGAGDLREYIQVQLTSPLITGLVYKGEMFVSPSEYKGIAVDAIGIYFSIGAISGNGTALPLQFTPQISNPINNIIIDTLDWTSVSGLYTALGGENYITIGNFLNDSSTNVIVFNPHVSQRGYYRVDDISVTLDTTTGIPETEKPKLKIFPNPAGNQITIEQLSVTGNQLSVEIYDAVGRLVTLSLASGEKGQQTTIPLNLSKGVYLLRVKEKEEVVFWEKLIIE
jgi:hypothetical protein